MWYIANSADAAARVWSNGTGTTLKFSATRAIGGIGWFRLC
jgi:hypothetical protein